MAERIFINDLTQTGRLEAPDPKAPRIFLSYNADFTEAANLVLDLTVINQAGVFGTVRSMFMDNGSNPNEVEISVRGTDQYFTVPPYAQGVFKIDANSKSTIEFTTAGGATDQVTITLYNYEVAPSVWYRFGTFNNDKPIMIEGTNPESHALAPTDNPVFIGGKSDTTGQLISLSVDQSGRVRVIGAAVGGNIFGTDAIGTPPTAAPVFIAGIDPSGEIVAVSLDATGKVETSPVRPSNSTSTAIAAAIVDTVILPNNPNRRGMTLYNDSNSILYLLLDNSPASTANYSLQIQAGGYYELPFGYTGSINAVWSAPDGEARITEFV
jgi:hypothetical protein